MTDADILGHIGYFFLAAGMFFLARKSLWGWVLRLIGELIWLRIGFMIEMSSVVFWGVIFAGMEIYGFKKWWGGREKDGNSGS